MAENQGENSTFAIIPEVYDDENAYENFENELEKALEACYNIIVIEPSRLGDETASWIAVGNCLHKTAVAAGMASVVTAFVWTKKPYVCLPLGVLSALCTGVYTLSWQFKPCVKYQVVTDFKKLLGEYSQLGILPALMSTNYPKSSVGLFSFNSSLPNNINCYKKTTSSILGLAKSAVCHILERKVDNGCKPCKREYHSTPSSINSREFRIQQQGVPNIIAVNETRCKCITRLREIRKSHLFSWNMIVATHMLAVLLYSFKEIKWNITEPQYLD